MTDFDATPSHRIRVHISEASTQKDKGKLIRDITIELGNQNMMRMIKDKSDVANIDEKEIQIFLFDLWDKITDEGKKRGKHWIDEVESE